MMVAILNLVCVVSCAQQNGSFHVISSLYNLVMGCKMFHHKPVVSVQSLKRIHRVTLQISTMCSSNFLSTCIPNAVVNYLLFQSLCWEVEKYYNTCHGKIDVCEV